MKPYCIGRQAARLVNDEAVTTQLGYRGTLRKTSFNIASDVAKLQTEHLSNSVPGCCSLINPFTDSSVLKTLNI
jgi:hypothetical protein